MLRLGSSNDVFPGLPEEDLAPAVCARILEATLGETVETSVRATWPTDDFAERVRGWLARHEPDVVILRVAPYWYKYDSVPLRVERWLGRAGAPIAKAGTRAAASPRIAYNRPFQALRRACYRFVGGDTNFTTDEVIARSTAVIRSIVAREGVVLVVRHCDGGKPFERQYHARSWRRRRKVDAALRSLCRDLHVPYLSNMDPTIEGSDGYFDGVHLQRDGQRRVGEEEAAAVLAALGSAAPVHTAASAENVADRG